MKHWEALRYVHQKGEVSTKAGLILKQESDFNKIDLSIEIDGFTVHKKKPKKFKEINHRLEISFDNLLPKKEKK